MMVLILDGKTAMAGIQSGIEICLRSLIPSLFPFFVLSALVTGALAGRPLYLFRVPGKICRIPSGSESLLAIGIAGGYPVGAKNVSDALNRKLISPEDAQRMSVFCNNAGPSFLFGVLGPLFSDLRWVWALWLIQIISAVITGWVLPVPRKQQTVSAPPSSITLADALNSAIKSMVQVSGWVIFCRMVLEFLDRWFLWLLPDSVQVLLTGLIELSNGCLCLERIGYEPLRFLIASVMLSLGGMSIWMQTKSVFPQLKLKYYLAGKMLQSLVGMLLCAAVLPLLTDLNAERYPFLILILIHGTLSVLLFSRIRKKEVAIP